VWLPSLLRQFSSHHPHAIVEVVCGPTPRLLEQLDKRAVDLAMISVPDEAATDDFIRREQLVWIGYPGLDTAQFDRLPLALPIPTRSITSRRAMRWRAPGATIASPMRAAASRG
jgi:DNA-binding transcriptional LysR family regulator